ncbi:hypothetical protein STH12_02826 [Shewanella khirikhana]|uniref:Uncharacterized protein n=1 Tax=Shewanella khirikhana TaxID=1965282 RepID=A0ABM7DQD1_9GAMM|nr:hypothetical protein STH12_02826 [Shewanella khirikhana]
MLMFTPKPLVAWAGYSPESEVAIIHSMRRLTSRGCYLPLRCYILYPM